MMSCKSRVCTPEKSSGLAWFDPEKKSITQRRCTSVTDSALQLARPLALDRPEPYLPDSLPAQNQAVLLLVRWSFGYRNNQEASCNLWPHFFLSLSPAFFTVLHKLYPIPSRVVSYKLRVTYTHTSFLLCDLICPEVRSSSSVFNILRWASSTSVFLTFPIA